MRTKRGLDSGFSGNLAGANEQRKTCGAEVVAAGVATAVVGLEEINLTQVAFDHLDVAPAERDPLMNEWAAGATRRVEALTKKCRDIPQGDVWLMLGMWVGLQATANAARGHLEQLLLATGKEGAA